MELLLYILLFILSLAVLVKGSDWFVEAAEVIGLSFGVSPFIVGVTIVAFGTSLPELAASLAAVFEGSSEIVVGNVVGSNITNILLVLGLTAVVARDIVLDFDVMDIDMPLLLGSSFLLYFVLLDLHLSVFECLILLSGIIIFVMNSVKAVRSTELDVPRASWKSYLVLVLGGVLVYAGAHFTILAIQHISIGIGISTDIIALTAVALGTSLPEVAVSISAARKGKTAIAVGNVLGSNVFNTFVVMGIPGLIGTLVIPPDMIAVSIPMMIVVTVLFAIVCISTRVSRWEGWMLLLFYVYFLYDSFYQV